MIGILISLRYFLFKPENRVWSVAFRYGLPTIAFTILLSLLTINHPILQLIGALFYTVFLFWIMFKEIGVQPTEFVLGVIIPSKIIDFLLWLIINKYL